MADPNPTGDRSPTRRLSPAKEDAIVESAVLSFVLAEHPDHLTVPELSLALNPRREGFPREDAVDKAIRDLVGAGLLYIGGGVVRPTRAALYFHDLEVM
jgi:hypothetical protein